MSTFFYDSPIQAPKILDGARIFIAQHEGGKRGMPQDLQAWLRAMGAKLVADIDGPRTKPVSHVLYQTRLHGHNPIHHRVTCERWLVERFGGALYLEADGVIAPLPSASRARVVLTDSHLFLSLCLSEVRAVMRTQKTESAWSRATSSLEPSTSPPAFVGF